MRVTILLPDGQHAGEVTKTQRGERDIWYTVTVNGAEYTVPWYKVKVDPA